MSAKRHSLGLVTHTGKCKVVITDARTRFDPASPCKGYTGSKVGTRPLDRILGVGERRSVRFAY